MTDSSTPDEPDRRGTVATGTPTDPAVEVPGATAAPNGAAAPEPASPAGDEAAASAARQADGPADGPAAGNGSPARSAEAPASSAVSDTVPTPRGATPPVSPPARERPAGPLPPPPPAPGPVPVPGPGAAAAPPWRRMSDAETSSEPAEPVRGGGEARPVLTEAPTTLLEPPAPGPSGDSGVTDLGGFSTVHGVRNRPPRQAMLQLKRLDPWSVLKLALVLAVVLFLIWLVAVGVLYGVLDGMGVWDRLNGTYADLVAGGQGSGNELISAGRVLGVSAVVGAINSLLFAVALTVGAFVYNVAADLVGGVEVTLSERD